MDSRIVYDLIIEDINRQVEILRERGVFVVLYPRLREKLERAGYCKEEIERAIVELRKSKQIMSGKFADKTGWVRDFRKMDEQ